MRVLSVYTKGDDLADAVLFHDTIDLWLDDITTPGTLYSRTQRFHYKRLKRQSGAHKRSKRQFQLSSGLTGILGGMSDLSVPLGTDSATAIAAAAGYDISYE